MFFCTILQWFTVNIESVFSGLFFCEQKGTRIFQWQEDIKIVVVIIALSSTKESYFFQILIFSQDISGKVHYVPEINLIFKGTLIKALYLLNKRI